MDDIVKQFDPDDVGLSDKRTAEILGVLPETLATWRSQGRGPRYRKSGRRVEYTPRFIKEYQQTCVRTPEPLSRRLGSRVGYRSGRVP
jgi:hypothetical protein